MAKLVVLTEGFAGAVLELKAERTTVGRLEDNAFRLAEASISGHHCEVWLDSGQVHVKDLNSTNGTFVNNQQIKEAILKPGETLRLGQIELRLENGTPPAAAAAAAPAPAAKKQQAHTMPIGGVKLDELENPGKPVGTAFAKKSDKLNKMMLIGFLVLGVIIIGLILYSIFRV
ncbi:MAG: FHA domain-containing protein [Verrucomicrobiales bacterium]|nr:FHA domain-containing protein [Verrucomicrobiales bacterium]